MEGGDKYIRRRIGGFAELLNFVEFWMICLLLIFHSFLFVNKGKVYSSFVVSSAFSLFPSSLWSSSFASSEVIPLPPMGWNSWNAFGCDTKRLNESSIMKIGDKLVESGLADVGYVFVNIDDCWMKMKQSNRRPGEKLKADEVRFPNGMKALGKHLHSQGLKFGIYADCGTRTCMGYTGSEGFEEMDAQTFTEWGVDYLKLDGCYANVTDMKYLYTKWSKALTNAAEEDYNDGDVEKEEEEGRFLRFFEKDKRGNDNKGEEDMTGRRKGREGGNKRRIVFSCSWPAYAGDVETFDFSYISTICDLWRVYGDISNTWMSLLDIMNFMAEHQEKLRKVVKQGSFNDPDILEVRNGKLTIAESQTQLSIWSILAAPLLLGNDLENMKDEVLSILTNRDVINVNQDLFVQQGVRVLHETEEKRKMDVWVRGLMNGDWAIAIVNLGDEPSVMEVDLDDVEIQSQMQQQMKNIRLYCRRQSEDHFRINMEEEEELGKRIRELEEVDNVVSGIQKTMGLKNRFCRLNEEENADEYEIRDLWNRSNLGRRKGKVSSTMMIESHGTFFIRLTPIFKEMSMLEKGVVEEEDRVVYNWSNRGGGREGIWEIYD